MFLSLNESCLIIGHLIDQNQISTQVSICTALFFALHVLSFLSLNVSIFVYSLCVC